MRLAQHREQLAAHHPIGAGPGLPTPGGAVVDGRARELPGAGVDDRAGAAGGGLRGAHDRSELHRRGVPQHVIVLRQQQRGESAFCGAQVGSGELDAGHRTRLDASDVRVDDGDALTERERRDGRCRVLADAGQREQVVVRRRHLAAVPFDHRDGGVVQPQGTTRVAEAAPVADGLAWRGGRQVRRGGPALEPFLPDRSHARDGRLLAHDLGQEDAPRCRVGGAPWQRARGIEEPGVETCDEVVALCLRKQRAHT